ncbi:ATP-binding protein, partial [Lacticaseibacillus paracasei]
MRPIIKWDGLTILRPFLELNKQEIVYYLAKRGHFEDASNHTSQFLRGRFRTEVFPFLKKVMRKEVTKSLSDLSH